MHGVWKLAQATTTVLEAVKKHCNESSLKSAIIEAEALKVFFQRIHRNMRRLCYASETRFLF